MRWCVKQGAAVLLLLLLCVLLLLLVLLVLLLCMLKCVGLLRCSSRVASAAEGTIEHTSPDFNPHDGHQLRCNFVL